MVDDIPIHYFAAHRRFFLSPSMARALSQQLTQFDLLHIHGIWTFPTLCAARLAQKFRVPYVVSPRGTLIPWARHHKKWRKQFYFHVLEKNHLQRASALHFTTSFEQHHCPSTLQKSQNFVVANPIDTSWFHAIKPLGTFYETPKLAMVGRLHPVKGFDLMFKVLCELKTKYPAVRLSIVGSDNDRYQERLVTLLQQLEMIDAVEFVGLVDRQRLQWTLEGCYALVVPSHQESFGLQAAEAMALGRPVIVSDQVALAREIQQHQLGAVSPLDVRSFYDAIVEVIDNYNKTQAFVTNAHEYAWGNFYYLKTAEKLLQQYSELLDSKAA